METIRNCFRLNVRIHHEVLVYVITIIFIRIDTDTNSKNFDNTYYIKKDKTFIERYIDIICSKYDEYVFEKKEAERLKNEKMNKVNQLISLGLKQIDDNVFIAYKLNKQLMKHLMFNDDILDYEITPVTNTTADTNQEKGYGDDISTWYESDATSETYFEIEIKFA